MKRPHLMGIVNLTPDSFSGDGALGDAALAHALLQVQSGADSLDIGAESTRPGATALSAEEEWARLGPFLAEATAAEWRANIRLSIDTRHAETAARALAMGADIINDVGGLTDAAMGAVLAPVACDIVVMHALTIPADPAIVWPSDLWPVAEILKWKAEVTARASAFGIAPERLIFDPGIGFGKSSEHSYALILGAKELAASGGSWLYGHSRKSFLTLFSDAAAEDRDPLTLAISTMLAEADIGYIRVHNIAIHQAWFTRLCT